MSPPKVRFVLSIVLMSTAPFVGSSTCAQEFEWARQTAGAMSEAVSGIAIDVEGQVHAVGYFEGTVDFDPGAGVVDLISAGDQDVYVWKLTGAGSLVWARAMGGSAWDGSEDVTVDENGNVYTVGFFEGTADFDPGSGTFFMTSFGNRDAFVSKLDMNGDFVWARQLGGSGADLAWKVAVDATGNVYTAGSFNGTADFDPGGGVVNLSSFGAEDGFVSKLDSDGDFVWVAQMGGASGDGALALDIDSNDEVVVGGNFNGTADFDPSGGSFSLTSVGGDTDVFVAKLTNGGALIWAVQLGGDGIVATEDLSIHRADDSIHIVGQFWESTDFDPSIAGTFNLVPVGGVDDAFVTKLDSDGNFVWARAFGGTSAEEAKAVTVDDDGNVYSGGIFGGTADFDPGAGVFNLTASGSPSGFLSKLDSSGGFVWAGQIDSTSSSSTRALALDSSSSLYAGGAFAGTADFDPGPGVINLTVGGGGDGFVVKLSQSTATVTPSQADPATGSTIVACIDIDTGSKVLGSYGATLAWDPAVLDYITYSGGNSPFDSPVVNAGDTANGTLSFADADPTGASGENHVLCVTFDVVGAAGTSSTLDLTLNSMFEAVTFVDLLPGLVDVDATVNAAVACTIGDVNGDAAINSGDALIILSKEIGLTIPASAQERIAARCADADGDGDTDSADANVVLSFEVGLDVSGNPINNSNVTTDDCSVCGAGLLRAAQDRLPDTSRPNRAEVVTSRLAVREGQSFEATVVVDARSVDRPLGSYTARLVWDADALEFLGALGGETPGFQSPMMNSNEASHGELRFTDANPTGATGKIELLRVQLRARRFIRNPASELRLSFSSMASTAPEFDELVPWVTTRPFLGTGRRLDLLQQRKQ